MTNMMKPCVVCGKPCPGHGTAEVTHGACAMERSFRRHTGGVVPWFLVMEFFAAQVARGEQVKEKEV